MALGNALALAVETPQINTVANYQASNANAQNMRSQRMQQEAAELEKYAQLGYGLYDGNLDGPLNEENFKQALGMMGDSPLRAQLEANPDLLRTIAKGSLSVLAQVRDDEKFEMAKKQFEVDLANAQRRANAPIEVSPGASLYDPATGAAIYTAPKDAATPNAPSGYRYTDAGTLAYIPGGPADPALAKIKPPTDADVRANKLASVVQGDKELLLGPDGETGIYNALTDVGSQIANTDVGVGGVGIGRPGYALTAPDFQSASNALTNIAQSYLYAISGQAAPAGEVAKIVESVTPKIGESEESVKNKRARLKSYIDAIEVSKYDLPATGAGSPAVGTVEDGYRYIGGDPGAQSSWEAVQ